MRRLPDVDIDCADREKVLEYFQHTPAAIDRAGKLVKHNTGVFVCDVPADDILGMATLDHKVMDELGYFKVDFLNLSVYEGIRDEAHLVALKSYEPNWSRLWNDPEFTEKVIHVNGQWDLLCEMRPDSVPRMAMFLAVMRPAKRWLAGKPWSDVSKEVWIAPEDDAYFFKKSHAVSYAILVGVHMNLIEEQEQHG